MRAGFVSEDARVAKQVEDLFDFFVSDRSDLEEDFDEFYNLEHDEDKILNLFEEKGVSTAVCLGYRRLFSGSFIERCEADLYNLHPSLLPAFKGLDVYQRVIDRGVKYSGATVHWIEEEMDEGEILDQIVYEVPKDVSLSELKELAAEHEVKIVRRNLQE